MAKDLPYFKFFCSEWNDGDITLETYEHQGLFINICSYYWSNECNVNFDKLLKRFRGNDELIDDLSAAGLFKLDEDRFISISFLDEQREERLEQSKVKSKGGKASAEARRLKKLQQETNTIPTENEHVLKSCSTETQLLREEEKRKEEKREEKKKKPIKKPKEPFIAPTEREFMIYAKSQFTTDDAYYAAKQNLLYKFKAWDVDNWKDGNGKQITSWKSKLFHNLKYIIG